MLALVVVPLLLPSTLLVLLFFVCERLLVTFLLFQYGLTTTLLLCPSPFTIPLLLL
jgi:hypothetical protein